MEKELILDTSGKFMVVGIAENDKIIYSLQLESFQHQSEIAMTEIYKALNITKTDPKEINRIVVTIGPGSYTGIRIALTIAKVYCSMLRIPLIAISSLKALAGAKGKKIAIVDAKSNRAYVGIYNEGNTLLEDCIMTIEEIKILKEKYNDYEYVGDTYLFNIDNRKNDLVKNLFELGKHEEGTVNVDNINPVYLKGN